MVDKEISVLLLGQSLSEQSQPTSAFNIPQLGQHAEKEFRFDRNNTSG